MCQLIPMYSALSARGGFTWGVVTVSKKLKQLKANGAANDDFTNMVKRLKKEGIFNGHKLTGEVIFFDDVKGYGFIKTTGGDSYFLHIQEIEGRQHPVKGDRFKFHVTGKNRANKAIKIN